MTRREIWMLGIRNVYSAPLRSILTTLGLAIGVGAILAVLTLGDAGQVQVRAEMKRLGIDKVWLSASEDAPLYAGDGVWLSEELNADSQELIYVPATICVWNSKADVTLVGCDESYLNSSVMEIVNGRMPHPMEWKRNARCVLVGTKLASDLMLCPGDTIVLGHEPYSICGVIESMGEFSRFDVDETVFLPLEVLSTQTDNQIHEVLLSVTENQMPEDVVHLANIAFRQRKRTEVNALTMQVQMEAADSVVGIFVDVLKWVALICILVGGVGVMNVLLVGIRERRREIGIMQSLGTSHKEIGFLFLLEALLYALAGGTAGLAFGWLIVQMAEASIGLSATIWVEDCITVLFTAVLIGVFFGVVPAMQAAKMKPVDALRMD